MVEPDSLDQLLHPMIDAEGELKVVATGLAASPGAAVGRVVFTAADAVERAEAGDPGDSRASGDEPRGHQRDERFSGYPHGARWTHLPCGRRCETDGEMLRHGVQRPECQRE